LPASLISPPHAMYRRALSTEQRQTAPPSTRPARNAGAGSAAVPASTRCPLPQSAVPASHTKSIPAEFADARSKRHHDPSFEAGELGARRAHPHATNRRRSSTPSGGLQASRPAASSCHAHAYEVGVRSTPPNLGPRRRVHASTGARPPSARQLPSPDSPAVRTRDDGKFVLYKVIQ
jgi:hypothetical protein